MYPSLMFILGTYLCFLLKGQHSGQVLEGEGNEVLLHAVRAIQHLEGVAPDHREVAMQDTGIQERCRSGGRGEELKLM